MKKILLGSLLLGGLSIVNATTPSSSIGIGTDTPHPQSALHLKSDSNQGIIIPTVDDSGVLPLSNPAEADSYSDDTTMNGMLMFDQGTSYMKLYNGTKWQNIVRSTGDRKIQQSFSATKNSHGEAIFCLVATCTPTDVNFDRDTNPPLGEDNEYITNAMSYDTNNTYDAVSSIFTAKKNGYYQVYVNVGVIIGISVSVANSYLTLTLSGSYAEGRWQDVAQTAMRMDILGLGGKTQGSIQKLVYLRKGDKLKVSVKPNFTISIAGLGINPNPNTTYFSVTKL